MWCKCIFITRDGDFIFRNKSWRHICVANNQWPCYDFISFLYCYSAKARSRLKNYGHLQNDILKEFTAQKEWIFPPKSSMRIVTDMLTYCSDHMPKFNTISIRDITYVKLVNCRPRTCFYSCRWLYLC